MSALRKSHITPEEYLALDRASETKSEYVGGRVYAMTGASLNHNFIVANIIGELRGQLKGSSCRVTPSDVRVFIPTTGDYVYPDVVVICGEPKVADAKFDILLNPTLIVEVLSESTEVSDRRTKFDNYRQISFFQEYLLVSQDAPRVERLVRQPNAEWALTVFDKLEDTVRLVSVDATLALTEVYDRVALSSNKD